VDHQTLNPARPREIITVCWPTVASALTRRRRPPRVLVQRLAPAINAGHHDVRRHHLPRRGLQLFDPRDGVGAPHPSSWRRNQGPPLNTDHCPTTWTNSRAVAVYAPQHTHPHPAFSPDGRYVVYTSDRTGHSQVYEVALP
jgi:oligogalacturonide lyase